MTNVKIVFRVEDADTGKLIEEERQVVMEFDPEAFNRKRQADKDKLVAANCSPEDADKILAPMHLGWSQDIVDAGFLSVARYSKIKILEYLGFPSAEELISKYKET